MDINCTNNCKYQIDGKCSLNSLPVAFSAVSGINEVCPYCMEISIKN